MGLENTHYQVTLQMRCLCVFTATGLCHNYKQVQDYFLTNSGTPDTYLVDFIFSAIQTLQNVGLKVIETVYEHRLNNQKAYIFPWGKARSNILFSKWADNCGFLLHKPSLKMYTEYVEKV